MGVLFYDWIYVKSKKFVHSRAEARWITSFLDLGEGMSFSLSRLRRKLADLFYNWVGVSKCGRVEILLRGGEAESRIGGKVSA